MMMATPSAIHATPRLLTAAWNVPTGRLCQRIDLGGIDLWQVDLDQRTPDAWSQSLGPDELARAARFVRRQHAERYLQAHHALRTLLAGYSSLPAGDLPILIDAQGKPALPPDVRLGFNLSHAGRYALIAVGRQRGIGVDIECEPPTGDLKALAHQVFSMKEWSILSSREGNDLTLTFLTGWTRKEACLKALGTGLLLEPCTIEAGLSPGLQRMAGASNVPPVAVTSFAIDLDGTISPGAAAVAVCESDDDRLGAVHCLTFSPHAPWEHD